MTLIEFLRETGPYPYLYEDFDNAGYEIIIAGHPGKVGVSFAAKNISINHNTRTIFIWI